MTTAETAANTFRGNFNCAQSVLSAFAEKYGLDTKTALKLACGFGSGIRSGEVCGVVFSAVIVIGLKYGHCESSDMDAKLKCYEKTDEFLRIFRQRHGSIICRDLIGCDVSTSEGRDKATKEDLFRKICAVKVRQAAELLEELGY